MCGRRMSGRASPRACSHMRWTARAERCGSTVSSETNARGVSTSAMGSRRSHSATAARMRSVAPTTLRAASVIERCTSGEDAGWLALRDGLWPQPRDLQLGEMAAIAAEPRRYAAFVAYGHDREPVGFAEAALRTDYVNGAQSSPVAFLEGLYVAPRAR